MLFSLIKKKHLFSPVVNPFNPLFTDKTVNPTLNEYLKNTEFKYMKNINKNIENRNKHKLLFGKNNESNSLVILPSVFLLSLTTIIYYFYSKIN
jgi:hypothetical protein